MEPLPAARVARVACVGIAPAALKRRPESHGASRAPQTAALVGGWALGFRPSQVRARAEAGDAPRNLYELRLLGLSPLEAAVASAESIKQRQRVLLKVCHPDIAGDGGAAVTALLTEAVNALSSAQARAEYEASLSDTEMEVGRGGSMSWPSLAQTLGTAVAGRVVMLTEQEIKCKASAANAAAPKQGKGGKGKKTPDSATLKLEVHLAGAESVNEVLYVEAWGEQGDLISIAGATHIPAGQNYSTSRLPYHLRVKGTVGVNVIVQKLDALPWPNVPVLHPLVPLRSLDRVKERQQICVAVQIEENPGTVERDTAAGRVPVCNAVVQQEGTRVRCAFWREQAGMLAARGPGECVLLYQVLVEKKKEGSWELGSWRATQVLDCPPDKAAEIRGALRNAEDCRMLTEVPIRDWAHALVAAIVLGHLRQMNTVFKVWGLQVMGVSSVRLMRMLPWSHAWLCEPPLLTLTANVPWCSTTTFSRRSCRHRTDTGDTRATLRDALRSTQWLCKLTFRENDHQQVLELECRHLEPFLDAEDLSRFMQALPRCALGKGCPVASLDVLQVDNDLGLLRAGLLDASTARVLVAFNDVQLPDEEALQQDPQSASAMRVKRSVDCLLAPAQQGEPVRAKLRAAGPASGVNWILRGRPGEVHQVVIMQTESAGEWGVLWHVPVANEAVASFVTYWQFVLTSQKDQDVLLFQPE
ncbi:unnamed protein product [Effrenium voratum]|nr:unnamed protein product [Effrenium voratum]